VAGPEPFVQGPDPLVELLVLCPAIHAKTRQDGAGIHPYLDDDDVIREGDHRRRGRLLDLHVRISLTRCIDEFAVAVTTLRVPLIAQRLERSNSAERKAHG
jgi:hypothetical protein